MITEQEYRAKYQEFNGQTSLLAQYYNLSERSIRNYNKKYNLSKRVNIDIDVLKDLYENKRLSITEIAKKLKVSRDTIYNRIEKHKLQRDSKYINIDILRQLYCEENYNITMLCDYFNVSRKLIINRLESFNIKNILKESLIELYSNNYSTSEIAEKLEFLEEEVIYYLKHFSIYNNKSISIDKETLQDLRTHKSIAEIAALYNCSERTIHHYSKLYNLEPKATKQFNFDLEHIKDLYLNKNLTQDEISDIFGCSRRTVGLFIKEAGIEKSSYVSSLERKIRDWLDSHNISYISNSRSIIAPYELDLYLPDYNLALELCGLYWHSTKFKNKSKYHIFEKHALCEKNNIRLIIIFEDEILNKENIVFNRLNQLLYLNKDKIYARKTIIKELSSSQGIEFLNQHHIQGSGRNFLYLGAFYKDTLVSVMSFSRNNPSKSNSSIELNRFANPFNCVGAASKLFSYYINHYYNNEKIITYADKRWNIGNLYLKLGFKYSHDSKPNYWYVVRQQRKHRWNYTKQRLLTLIPDSDSNSTEEQLAESLELYRIYDCGNKVYHYSKF